MNNTNLTLYDFLNYEVVGVLMLLACNIKPNTIDTWLFFIFAYIVGLIVSKLNENCIWSKCLRNPQCLIDEAERDLENIKTEPNKSRYYISYYRIFGNKVSDNIRILEAQYAFVWNLIIPTIVYVVMFAYCSERLNNIFNTTQNNICICPLAITIVILGIASVLTTIIENQRENVGQNCCMGCGYLLLIIISCLIFIAYCLCKQCIDTIKNEDITQQRIGATLALLTVLLPYLAYRIQKKIAILVVEGGEYLHKTKKNND